MNDSVSNEAEARDILKKIGEAGLRLVMWPEDGDAKGPRETGWPSQVRTPEEWHPGLRTGALLGTEIKPGRFLFDIDIDWGAGAELIARLLPPTGMVFGRASKRVSHAFYTAPEPIPTRKFLDTDKTVLLELRGSKADGSIGHQTMIPPSVWSKDGRREVLTFARFGEIHHFTSAELAVKSAIFAATGCILGKKLGKHGFGHEARLAWAGFILRAGMDPEFAIAMGETLSWYCENTEVKDVRTVVESTIKALAGGKKTRGGPALSRMFAQDGDATISRVQEWLGHDTDFVRGKSGGPLGNQENIRRALGLLEIELERNTFAERSLYRIGGSEWALLDDGFITTLRLRIEREYRFLPDKDLFWDVLDDVAREHSYHPVRQYLEGLRWDGVARLDTWIIETGHAKDTPYVRAVSAILLIAACRRIWQPGVKYDEMLVLESIQGADKSSALRVLCPHDDWFSDDLPLNVDSKQVIERTLGKWLIEASDLAGKRKADVEHVKAMLSRQIDGPARLAYARSATERKRQFVLVGTANPAPYLHDSTGGRRFWPIAVTRFDLVKLRGMRDQLWAEAAARESAGESIRLAEELWSDAGKEQDSRLAVDAWESVIVEFLNEVEVSADGRRRVLANDIWQALAISIDRRDRTGSMRISEVMNRLGFRNSKVREGIFTHAGYVEVYPRANLLPQDENNEDSD